MKTDIEMRKLENGDIAFLYRDADSQPRTAILAKDIRRPVYHLDFAFEGLCEEIFSKLDSWRAQIFGYDFYIVREDLFRRGYEIIPVGLSGAFIFISVRLADFSKRIFWRTLAKLWKKPIFRSALVHVMKREEGCYAQFKWPWKEWQKL